MATALAETARMAKKASRRAAEEPSGDEGRRRPQTSGQILAVAARLRDVADRLEALTLRMKEEGLDVVTMDGTRQGDTAVELGKLYLKNATAGFDRVVTERI